MLFRSVTIGHRAIVHSAQVGDGALIGMGATLLNRSRIGARCLVGAGALVTENKIFDEGKMILGAPARVLRDLSAEELSGLKQSAAIYVANGARYRERLREI